MFDKTRDVLDYKNEEFENLSLEELEFLYDKASKMESMFNTKQLVVKVSMNSLYGALANKHFPLYNTNVARAITGNGRYFITILTKNLNRELSKIYGEEHKFAIYNDTDSCLGNTIVSTSTGNVKIEDLYELTPGVIDILGKDNFVKHIDNFLTAKSVSESLNLEDKKIKYIMKHKVTKRMFKIKCNGDEVTITEDHSIQVLRDNKLIEIKPKDILKNDKLIKL